jgi:hypothetical protein
MSGTASIPRDRRNWLLPGHIQPVGTIAADRGGQADLAWSLAEAVKSHLSIVERNHVYVAIGIDETFTAIHRLITSAATNQIVLPDELVQRCGTWLDAYVGHSQQQHLRGLVEYVLAPLSARESFASYGPQMSHIGRETPGNARWIPGRSRGGVCSPEVSVDADRSSTMLGVGHASTGPTKSTA